MERYQWKKKQRAYAEDEVAAALAAVDAAAAEADWASRRGFFSDAGAAPASIDALRLPSDAGSAALEADASSLVGVAEREFSSL